jgi:hypothetical protein
MSEALRDHFLGWQCRVRQYAIREEEGRPPEGGCPDLSLPGGTGTKIKIVTLINKENSNDLIEELKHLYKKQTEPNERLAKIIQNLSAAHYQQPKTFSDELTALFIPGSTIPEQVLANGQAVLEFKQYNQSYKLLCDVRDLDVDNEAYQMTFWHNKLFNPKLTDKPTILGFKPLWDQSSSEPPIPA